MIEKPTIVITSLGRTGTKFFYALFREIIPDGTSLHEPDVLNIVQYQGAGERVRQVLAQVREAGALNLIVRKALGKWGLIELSDARVRGELGYAEAAKQVLGQREGFVSSRSGSVYIEANVGYYGLIDVMKDVCMHSRTVYIVRDGRDWVRSHMNWGQMYGKGRFRRLLAHTWPTALEIAQDSYGLRWGSMSRFEKLCWAWAKLNAYALATVQENPDAKVFRFEDVFHSQHRYQHLADLVQFAMTFPHAERIATGPLEGWLEKRIHTSFSEFPNWEEWSIEQKRQFEILCGPLMKELNYV
jgi:hypothetical protein